MIAEPLTGAEVREMRQGLGLTQAEFGERLGVGRHSVRDWERGKRAVPGPANLAIRLIYRLHDETPPRRGSVLAVRSVWCDIREALLQALWG